MTLLIALAAFSGCSGPPGHAAYRRDDGSHVPCTYRHEVILQDTGTRAPIRDALVAVRSGLDPVWQFDWTDGSGTAVLVQEYEEEALDDRIPSLFYDIFGEKVRLDGAAARTIARHPAYLPYQLFTAAVRRDLAKDISKWPMAEVSRSAPSLLEPRRGQDGKPIGATMTARPNMEQLLELAAPEPPRKDGAMLRKFPPVNADRLVRDYGGSGLRERGCKLYRRNQDGAVILLVQLAPEDPGSYRERIESVARTAERRIAGPDWARALEASSKANVRTVALVVAPGDAVAIDRALRDPTALGRCDLVGEWWVPVGGAMPPAPKGGAGAGGAR